MVVTFILPGMPTRATGGTKIVLEYANRLMISYPEVNVCLCYLIDPNVKRLGPIPCPLFVKSAVDNIRSQFLPKWFTLDRNVRRRCIFSIDNKTVPDGDWVFATAASTAPGVAGLSSSKGKKGYLIQGYETWEMDDASLAATYRLGMTNVVIAEWLKQVVDGAIETGKECTCISNPVDTRVFYPQGGVFREPHTVAVLHHKGMHKGFRYAWGALEKVKQDIPGLKVEMFGACPAPEGLPSWVRYTKDATEDQLRRIYSASSVYVCASVNEGYGLTCVEAMACGCALIVTDFAGSKEYAVDGVNSIVAPVGDVNAIAEGIVKVLRDGELRSRLAAAGIETARRLDWEIAIERFATILGLND